LQFESCSAIISIVIEYYSSRAGGGNGPVKPQQPL